MKLPDPYPVRPWTRPCRGEVRLPGSKSLTNRALVLAALRDRPTRLEGALFSRDSRLLADGLRALGIPVTMNEAGGWVEVSGAGGIIPRSSGEVFVGNAGTAARFLTALACLRRDGRFRFDGDPEMRRRPMAGLLQSLERLGAAFTFGGEPYCFPFEVRTNGLRGGTWEVDASASSQMLSALLMVAPFAGGAVRIEASGARPAFVGMTARLMRQFGLRLEGDPQNGYDIPSGQAVALQGTAFPIEPDATAASYFMLLPHIAGGSLFIHGMSPGMLQGDVAFAGVLRELGFRIREEEEGWAVTGPRRIDPEPRRFSFETFSDTFLTLAAAAPLFPCPITLTGIGHTRFQECDRIAAAGEGLAVTGARVLVWETGIAVQPYGPGRAAPAENVVIHTYKDHRVAMAFAVLGCRDRRGDGKPWLAVADPGCSGKTFPGFFQTLENLYRISHDK